MQCILIGIIGIAFYAIHTMRSWEQEKREIELKSLTIAERNRIEDLKIRSYAKDNNGEWIDITDEVNLTSVAEERLYGCRTFFNSISGKPWILVPNYFRG